MTRCAVQGLLLGGCCQEAVPGEDLCFYHHKLKKGLLTPPGDDGFFITVPGETPMAPAILAELSYAKSTYPEFAYLVPTTGGYSLELAAA